MKLHLTVILIYISLVSNKDEHVPVYLKKKNELLVSLICSK